MNNKIENVGENENIEERMCSFFASDYHFELITLQYIKNKLEQDENVVILTQNNLNDSVKKVINNMNIDENQRKRIFKLDWNNKEDTKLEFIKNEANSGRSIVVFVKGEKDYINNVDSYMKNNIDMEKVETIHCFDVAEVTSCMNDVVSNYKGILNMSGMIKF